MTFKVGDVMERTAAGDSTIPYLQEGYVFTIKRLYGSGMVYDLDDHIHEIKNIKPVDKFASLKAAHAAGKVIQYWSRALEKWADTSNNSPLWLRCEKYRIKPEETRSSEMGDIKPPESAGIKWPRGGEYPFGIYNQSENTVEVNIPTTKRRVENLIDQKASDMVFFGADRAGGDSEYRITASGMYNGVCFSGKNDPTNWNTKNEETKMIKIENKTYVNGTDVNNLNDDDMLNIIEAAELDVKALRKIKAKSTKKSAKIKTLQSQIDQLVVILDERDAQ